MIFYRYTVITQDIDLFGNLLTALQAVFDFIHLTDPLAIDVSFDIFLKFRIFDIFRIRIKNRLQRGKEIAEQINILGDDGVPVEYHVTFWKSELIDFVILQQDAFDEIDAVTPMERQEDILNMIIDICHTEF